MTKSLVKMTTLAMERSRAGFMADALAAGQMQTEAGTEALMAEVIDNQTVYLGDETFELVDGLIVPVEWGRATDHPQHELWVAYMDSPQLAQDYIETLEQAVLKSWERRQDEWERGEFSCNQCFYTSYSGQHTPDCIVPALLEKYA